MKAPSLNCKIVLEDAYRVPDESGGFQTIWQPLGTVWAQVTAGRGRAQVVNALPLSRVPHRIIVRAAPEGSSARPRAGQRFREGTRIYDIQAVRHHDTARRYLECQTLEEIAT